MVGRRAELATLEAAARRAAVDGRGSAAVVVGEPGIGKTHLLEAFAEAANDLGLGVFAASAYELERRRPFGVLVDALGVRPGVEESWRARVAARLDAQATGGDPAGFLIGEEIVALVDELCTRGPTALVLDDVQWVDPASLGLIARLCRVAPQQRLMVVLSVRPPPRPDDVTRLVTGIRAADGVELTVGPLADDEVAELAAAVVGAPPGDSLWPLLRRTGGSPLFVRELIAGLRADGALRIDGDRVETTATGIPASLSVAVRHRLAQLDPTTMEMLRLAAVLGGPFTLPQLGHVTGRRPVELYATVETALEAGVLRDDEGRLRFTHEVIRATLYDDIPHAVRIGLHRDMAGALDAAGAPALEVAEHYLRCATPGDRQVVQGLRQAATTIARQSPAAAADLLDRAAALLPSVDPERPALAQERARYLAAGGRAVDAEALCRELLQSGAEPGAERPIRRILASALLAQSRMTEALDEARWLAAGSVPESAGWARATAALSYALLTAGQLTEAEHTARQMTERADVVEPSAVFTACMTLAVACRFRARGGEALMYLDRAAEMAGGLPRQVVDQNPVGMWRALVLLDLDRLDEALVAARRGRAAAEEAGVSWALANYGFATASTLYARGDVDDAVAEYRAGMDLAADLGTGWRLSAYGGLASIAVRRDDLDGATGLVAEGEAYLRRTGDQPQLQLFLRAKAELLEAQGRPAEALAELVGVWWPLVRGDVLGSVPFFATDVVRLAVAEGDDELAAAMLAAARTAAERMGTSTSEATVLRCHGIIHHDPDAFVAAADAVADNPRPLARAGAHEDAGVALTTIGRPEDARSHLVAALDAYELLGAVRDVDRVDATARRIGVRRGQRGRRSRPRHGWDSLTTTERRVADLVASGLSNPVIAERMFLSRRTIQTHVSHILTKTGLSSRIELAAAMARRES